MTLLAPQSDTDADLLAALAVELDAAQHAVGRMHDYYAGKHPLAFATPKFSEAFGPLFKTFASNWCGLVVDVPRQRLQKRGARGRRELQAQEVVAGGLIEGADIGEDPLLLRARDADGAQGRLPVVDHFKRTPPQCLLESS